MEGIKQPRYVMLMAMILLFGFMQTLKEVPVPLHYVFIIASLGLVLTSLGDEWSINWRGVVFLLVAAISIIGNDIPVFFKPWQRFVLFSMLMVGCSPLMSGTLLDKVKRHITMGGIWAVALITLLSFVGYFLGFGKRMTGIVDSYMGITVHANFLGFFSMVSATWFTALFFRSTKMMERYIWGGCWAACIITLLLCASRSALAGGLAGTLLFVYLRFQKNATALLNTISCLVVIVIMSLPRLMVFTDAMMKKNMNFDDTDSMVEATRGGIWDLRFAEIAESPVIGVGAYSCDIHLPFADTYYVSSTGTIELGSSYLGLISQCGWLGMIAFLAFVIPILWKTYKYATEQRTPYAQLWFPLLIVIASNMVFEGYLMTAGAVQCILVWLALGSADQCDKVADYPVFWENEDPITPEEYEDWREYVAEDGDKR